MPRIDRAFSVSLLSLLCVMMMTATPAEARRRFRFGGFGGGSSETITKVYNLPDEEPYVKQGNFFDVGWLNSNTRSGYVIYHGDRFTKLDDADIAALTEMLGKDPTAAHRAAQAGGRGYDADESAAERKHKDDLIASGQMIERKAGESSADFAKRVAAFSADHKDSGSGNESSASGGSKGYAAGGIGALLTLLSLLWMFRKPLFRGIEQNRAARVAAIPLEPQHTELNTESFDEKVARRLAQLQDGPLATAAAPAPMPQVRGFGRKAA